MLRGRRLVAVCLSLLLCVGVLLRFGRHRPLSPLQVGLWYWHAPFRITKPESEQLRAAGVTQLYIRAGTFVRDDTGVRLTLRQRWRSPADGLETHLVFNFDYTVVRGFAQMDTARMARDIAAGVREQLAQTRRAGLQPAGVQFDFDCATHSLSRYAGLLKRLRTELVTPDGFKRLSITALPTWYGSGAVRQVAAAVDYMVPQFYEPRLGPTLEQYAVISCLPALDAGMQAAGGVGRPFYVGVPAYGHALMYDDRGSLAGLYRDMNVIEAAHHHAFRVARDFPSDADGNPATKQTACGENLVDLVAVQAGAMGKGLGYHLIYDLPTPDLVARHLALIRKRRPPECQGVILFCYPEPEGTLALPLPALTSAIAGKPTAPNMKVQITAQRPTWRLIETGASDAHPPLEISVAVTNVGNAGLFFAPDGLTLTLYLDRPGFEEAIPHDFDNIESGLIDLQAAKGGSESGWQRCSLPRANLLQLKRFELAPGEMARIGPLSIPPGGATRIWGRWEARSQNGFDLLRGDVPSVTLK
jgi:hypothetical protein